MPSASISSHWLRLKRSDAASPSYVSGKLDAQVKVKGSGRSTAEILGSLNGDVRAHVREASISHLVIEMLGLDVAQALGLKLKGDKALPILCNVVDLDVAGGVAKPKVFVLNTTDSTVFVDGSVSLKTEAMDLRAVVSPKDFSPLTLRTPILVRGTLGDPAVSIEVGKLVGKAAAATLLGVLVAPLAAIVPFVDPGSRDAAKETAAPLRGAGGHQRQDLGGDAGAQGRAGASAVEPGERRQGGALSRLGP